ncbi:MAG: hypothetical protein DRJ03_23535 [Chloroflexi bacterium]|nr:MAG: hypothetical protein DRJ03_23535 [Chloroflexota bacterium]
MKVTSFALQGDDAISLNGVTVKAHESLHEYDVPRLIGHMWDLRKAIDLLRNLTYANDLTDASVLILEKEFTDTYTDFKFGFDER